MRKVMNETENSSVKISRKVKKRSALFLFMVILALLLGAPCMAAGKSRLSRSKISMSVNQKKNLKLISSSGEITWRILSGKKNISIKKSGNKTVVVTAKKTGTAVIQAKNKGKKFVCRVTVQDSQSGSMQQGSGGQQMQEEEKTEEKPKDNTSGHQASGGNKKEEEEKMRIVIKAGRQSFSAVLYDNEAAELIWERLPLTLDMSEMNGNEKYYFMDEKLPVDSQVPDAIHEGDLMLYGSDCLVLFYKNFSTSYKYTPLGHVENPSGLAEALGTGDVRVTFERMG